MATFAIVGATGLIGEPIAKAILRLGHTGRVITRGRSPSNTTTLDQLQQGGAEIHCGAPNDIPWMTKTRPLTAVFNGGDLRFNPALPSPPILQTLGLFDLIRPIIQLYQHTVDIPSQWVVALEMGFCLVQRPLQQRLCVIHLSEINMNHCPKKTTL